MTSHERMVSNIRDVYSAAADEHRWPVTLERLADEFRGGVAGLQYRAGIEGRIQSSRFVRFDPALTETYRAFARRNPWTRISQPLYQTGFVFSPERLLPVSDLRRTAFYDEILRPQGLLHCFGSCVFRREDDVMSFTVVRSPVLGAYDDSELRRVQALLPHLHRAMQVNERLAQLQRTHTALATGLDHLHDGVIVVSRRGRASFVNRAARTMAAQRDGFLLTEDGPAAAAPGERLRLRSLLDDAVRTATGEGFGSGGAMTISRPSMKRAFLVLVVPLRVALDTGTPPGTAAVFVSDPETRAETLEDFLRRIYGLTATETRVATAFAATGDLAQVGERLKISRETVRWHMRHLYRKTGTHRQAALLQRLVAGPLRFDLRTASSSETVKPAG